MSDGILGHGLEGGEVNREIEGT